MLIQINKGFPETSETPLKLPLIIPTRIIYLRLIYAQFWCHFLTAILLFLVLGCIIIIHSYIQKRKQKQKQHINYTYTKNYYKLNLHDYIYRQRGKTQKAKTKYIHKQWNLCIKIHLEKLSQVTDASTILQTKTPPPWMSTPHTQTSGTQNCKSCKVIIIIIIVVSYILWIIKIMPKAFDYTFISSFTSTLVIWVWMMIEFLPKLRTSSGKSFHCWIVLKLKIFAVYS